MSEEINMAEGNVREIMRLRGLLAMAEADNARLKEERRALCDLLSAQPEAIAGNTLVDALQTVLDQRDKARNTILYALTALNGYVPIGADRVEEARRFLLQAHRSVEVLGHPAPPPYALVPVEDLRAAELCERAADRLRRAIAAPASDAIEAVARAAIEAEREASREG